MVGSSGFLVSYWGLVENAICAVAMPGFALIVIDPIMAAVAFLQHYLIYESTKWHQFQAPTNQLHLQTPATRFKKTLFFRP